jgi:hypothetical protein
MSKFAKVVLSITAMAAVLVVGNPISLWASAVPEIDPSSGMASMALLAGAVMVVRGWRRK